MNIAGWVIFSITGSRDALRKGVTELFFEILENSGIEESQISFAIASGMICDGAKASCAAKIASAVEAGLLGMQMQMHESQFYGGDGIVVKGVENTIRNIGTLASEGMRETDRTIIRMMIQEH